MRRRNFHYRQTSNELLRKWKNIFFDVSFFFEIVENIFPVQLSWNLSAKVAFLWIFHHSRLWGNSFFFIFAVRASLNPHSRKEQSPIPDSSWKYINQSFLYKRILHGISKRLEKHEQHLHAWRWTIESENRLVSPKNDSPRTAHKTRVFSIISFPFSSSAFPL